MTGLPPWPAEDFRCGECGFDFSEVDPSSVPQLLDDVVAELRSYADEADPAALASRPAPAVWSPIEYVCHLHDVFVATTIRLYRVRVEDHPQLEPLYNDLRAERFRYRERTIDPVLDFIDAAVAGCADEIGRVTDWSRPLTRLPGEQRTAAWVARAAVHEGVHHLGDLRPGPPPVA